jgi:hypothetical protein
MICFTKPLLTEDLCEVQKETFSITCLCAKYTLDEEPNIYVRDKPIFSSEGCYIRTITARVELKKSVVVGLKGPDAKTN